MVNKTVPESKLSRTGIAGIAIAKVGLSELQHKVKRPFLSREKSIKEKESLDDKNAKIIFKAITQLRGTALKAAQILGMEQGLLPESYRKELSKSFHQVPPLNRVLIRKVMLEELKQTPEDIFKTFDHDAFAAASLGQVHNASLTDNTPVAVKIQYPGINASIASDIAMVKGIARGLPNTTLILQSMNEIEARLLEETNYNIEAQNTQWFKENVTLSGINIPNVYPEFSTRKILTTDLVDGLHLDEWLANKPSRKSRNTAAQLLYDFFLHSSDHLKCLHSDPNPGNYLFHDNGTITVIDFGCVRKLEGSFSRLFSDLMNAYIEDDFDRVFTAYRALGMIHEHSDKDFYDRVLRPFGQWVSEPFKVESFDFLLNKDYTLRGNDIMREFYGMLSVDRIVDEFIFHNRTIYGLYQIFEKMGATVKMQHHIMGCKK